MRNAFGVFRQNVASQSHQIKHGETRTPDLGLEHAGIVPAARIGDQRATCRSEGRWEHNVAVNGVPQPIHMELDRSRSRPRGVTGHSGRRNGTSEWTFWGLEIAPWTAPTNMEEMPPVLLRLRYPRRRAHLQVVFAFSPTCSHSSKTCSLTMLRPPGQAWGCPAVKRVACPLAASRPSPD